MFVAYIIVIIIAAAANIFSATLDFIRFKQILVNMAKVGVPESWITMLGTLKVAGRSDSLSASVCHRSESPLQSVYFYSSSPPSLLICAHATTRSGLPASSSSWPGRRWCCDWPRPKGKRRLNPTIPEQGRQFCHCHTALDDDGRRRGVMAHRDRSNRRLWQQGRRERFLTRCIPCSQSII